MTINRDTEKYPFDFFIFEKKNLRQIYYISVPAILSLFFELKIKYYLPNNENFAKKAELFTSLFIIELPLHRHMDLLS
jgi:hypothetical protein